ncbi:MAG: MMPL family transporter, partial [Phycisphaerae bacterium]
MPLGSRIVAGAVSRYKVVAAVMAAAAMVVASAAVLPSVFPRALGFLHPIEVDTDPENMLSATEPVRVFHDRMKRELDLHDMVVVGVVNDKHPDGVFNPSSLRKVHELTEYAGTLNGPAIGEPPGEGVIARDIIAPSTVDNIEPRPGGISFSWLMPAPPETPEAARKIRRSARRIPFLNGTMVADKPGKEGKAVAIYLPLTRKDLSYKVYSRLRERIPQLQGDGPERFYITGLPVAEDTFGVEMFVQMAISAPAAMLVIFVLMLVFFRKLVVVIAPMIVAMASVIFTTGALVIAGFPIHIMSSMIPIFIMPIAVLDSVHIISEFFEKYQATRDRRKTILGVMDDLFMPMLYTSLTSTAGFASLALTPIPPVQVFGAFVAAGIMVAWLLTVVFVPAYIMFISPKTLANFGAKHAAEQAEDRTVMGRALRWVAGATFRRARPILAVSMLVLAVAIYGITRININDNPVKWFTPSHPIREADTVLNQHFGGTYMAYLAMETDEPPFDPNAYAAELVRRAEQKAREPGGSEATAFGGWSLKGIAQAAARTRPASAEEM